MNLYIARYLNNPNSSRESQFMVAATMGEALERLREANPDDPEEPMEVHKIADGSARHPTTVFRHMR